MSRQPVMVTNRSPDSSGRQDVDPGVRRRDVVAEEIDRSFKMPLARYLWQSRILVVLSSPLLYFCFLALLVLDISVSTYQAVCVPIYEIPKVHRADYLIFDRSRLRYLNHLERVNCRYCSYANGLIAYVGEIAARTEQHWCPIKHSREIPSPHSRYDQFLHYGDAAAYREGVERVRRNFDDLNG